MLHPQKALMDRLSTIRLCWCQQLGVLRLSIPAGRLASDGWTKPLLWPCGPWGVSVPMQWGSAAQRRRSQAPNAVWIWSVVDEGIMEGPDLSEVLTT